MVEDEGLALIFNSLQGGWRLEKTFSDGSRFEGSALFDASGENGLELHETGVLTLAAGNGLRAERRWKWQLSGPARLVIRFAGEREEGVYHLVDMRPQADIWSGSAEHVCGADRYSATYRLQRDDIAILHEIRGPRKAIRIAARFARSAG